MESILRYLAAMETKFIEMHGLVYYNETSDS